MLSLMMYLFMISLISMMMLSIPLFMSLLMNKWQEKSSLFECGMNMNSTSRKPFSIRFFLMMILFIIFDVEIILIIIIPIMPKMSIKMLSFFNMFILILFIGLMYEWMEGSLNWKL